MEISYEEEVQACPLEGERMYFYMEGTYWCPTCGYLWFNEDWLLFMEFNEEE